MPVLDVLGSWRDRPLAFFAAVFALAAAVAGVERFAARLLEPEPGARWIWAAGDYRGGEPIAFYAVRDLELRAGAAARIAIVADETYLLYVNGQRVAAGAYRRGAPVDEVDVGDLMEPGLNRILVELRSSRGAGGLLATLELDGGGGPGAVVTDGSWRIFRHYDPGLFGGWSTLEGGEAPKIWQRPPTGRWRPGAARARRQVPPRGFPPPARRRPLRVQQQHTDAWLDLDWTRARIPALGPHQLYDFGAEVEGYLSFDLTSDEGLPGLLYFGSEPPDPRTGPDEVVLPVPGRRHWEDAYPRRFRYLLVVGAEPYSRLEVELLDAERARALAPPGPARAGVFGLEPPRSYSKVEEDVWERPSGPSEDSGVTPL